MRRIKNVLFYSLTALLVAFTIASCTDSTVEPDDTNTNNDSKKTGQVSFEATDGPIDDASVQGAFVTISEIKIDGETYGGFSGKQTIDLLAYQNGETKALGLADIETGTYSEITLVLDYETDMNGDAPGCYILKVDNTKEALSASAMGSKELVLDAALEVKEDTESKVVLDFDLRKAVTYNESNGQSSFEFVTDAELESAIRVLDKEMTGQIEGEVEMTSTFDTGEKVVVYAYKEGSFDANMETSGQGTSNIEFMNAETSAVLDAEGKYTLAFLEEGDYELHFFSYEDNDNDGKLEIKGMLEVSSLLNINTNNVSVTANANVSLDLSITGLLIL